MSDIERKIMEYGQSKEKERLQQFIANVNTAELLNALSTSICNLNGADLWDYTLNAFLDTEQSHNIRFKVISSMLNKFEKNEYPSSHVDKLITLLCPQLFKLKSNHLMQLSTMCYEKIQNGSDMSSSWWKDLFPKILSVLIERQLVDYEDEEISGTEYKSKIVNSLCSMIWSPNIILALAKMFIVMPLTKEEHLKVVNRLCQNMENLSCQEIPPFVYQLLELCRHEHSNSIFLQLQRYFGTRIYNRLSDTSTENSDLDAIESASDLDNFQVESTVLFYIHQNDRCIKEFINLLKTLSKSPEFVLHPFNITVLLTISSVPSHTETVLNILKTSIAHYFAEEYRKRESSWYRETVPKAADINIVFSQIIEFSVKERPHVVEGLVHLAFKILDATPSLSKESVNSVAKQAELGNFILVKVVKRQRYLAGAVVEMLRGNMSRSNNVQYIDCLQVLCCHLPLVLLENQGGVILLLEEVLQLPGRIAIQLLEAVMPLIKMSTTVRDHLILLLRKALYKPNTETRQMAVIGFLTLLKHMKVTNLAALSQSSSTTNSAHSYLTQISMESRPSDRCAFSNEALCLEVLEILKCCFSQQVEVRAQLYEGLYDAVCTNPELGIPVLDMLGSHLLQYFVADVETVQPLRFSDVAVVHEVEAHLKEPLAKLIYSIGLIVAKVQEAQAVEENETVTRFLKILESICTRMSQCELIHFELDDGTNLLDNIPEAQTKLIVLKEAIFVYEALIGYKISSWGLQTPNCGKDINTIFKSYARLISFSKNLSKPKKAEKETKRKQDKSQAAHNDDSSSTRTTKSTAKTPAIKTTTILNLQTLNKILNLLHRTRVDWTTAAEASVVRIKPDFNRFIMECTIQQIEHVNQQKMAETKEKRDNFTHFSEIAAVLYKRCIKRLTEFVDFDCQTALLSVECFHHILSCVSKHYSKQLLQFLSVVGEVDENKDLEEHLMPFIETYQDLLNTDLDEIGDSEIRKLPPLVINTLVLINNQLPHHKTNSPSFKMLSFLKGFAKQNVVPNKNVANAILSLLFNLQFQCKSSVGFFESVANQTAAMIGVIDGDAPEVTTELKMINEAISQNILQLICHSVKCMLDDVHYVIDRLKSEHQMITYPGEDNIERRRELLKIKERCVCCNLSRIVGIVSTLCNITVPIGNASEAVIKIITHVYSTLSSLAKHLTARSSKANPAFQHANFEQLIKLSGKRLTAVVYAFIMHIEECQKRDEETQQAATATSCGGGGGTQATKKKIDAHLAKTKLLRERVRIPKLIYEIEQFGKCVFQLSTKTKCDLSKLLAQGTVRDFRLNGVKDMVDAYKERNRHRPDADDSAVDRSSEAAESDDEINAVDESDKENLSDGEESELPQPPPKRAKIF